jgi:hypothetical protein
VMTLAGDPLTDTVVNVLRSNADDSLGGPSTDASYHEFFVSAPIESSADHFVEITASSYFDPAQSHYQAVIWVE